MQYIILNGKQPTHKFKDGQGKTWDEVKDYDDIAVIVPKGYVVLDFDTTSDAEIMLKIVDGLGLKTRVMKTTRGIHCWFKTNEEEPKNFIKNRLAVGIYCDRKAGGRNAYVKIKQDGEPRAWIRKVNREDMEVVPKWLSSISAPSNKFSFKDLGEGSGRNQELFNYVVYLQTKGFSREEIRETIRIVNDYVLAEPLPVDEVETILRDEAFKPDDVIAEQIAEAEKRSTFSHISVAEEIITKHRLIKYNSTIFEYIDNFYQPAEFLRKYVRDTYKGAKNNQVNEVISYISDMQEIKRGSIKVNPYILNLENTRLDIRSGRCIEFTPDVIEFDRIPVAYDPSAYCADVDKMLNKVFLGDREVIDLFEEMLGAVLIKHNRYQKGFLFYGSGSNGKSTILNLIKEFLGFRNYTTMSIQEVTERFNKAELEYKLANIGDDINNSTLKDTGTLKKLISGDAISVEKKGGNPYTIEPYATHIYSCNNIPASFDKSDGFYRRFTLIPFNAKLSPKDEDYDPMILDKITEPTALSYVLNIAIRGAERLIKNGGFTEPQSVKDALENYKIDNSNVLSWIEDKELDEDYFLDNSTDKLYSDFADWCRVGGSKTSGRNKFYKEVRDKFDFEEKTRQKSDGKRYFMMKI